MKKFVSILLALVMIMAMAACGSAPAAPAEGNGGDNAEVKTVVLKAGMSGSETTPTYVALSEFKRLVEEKTEGRYSIEIYTNDQLSSGDQTKGIEMMLSNSVDLEMHAASLWSSYIPQMQVVGTPFLFAGYDDADKLVLDPESAGHKLVEEWVASTGAHNVGILEQGFRQVSNSKKEITTVADLKGLKFRVPQVAMLVDCFEMLGSSATPMSFSEVYTALQQGTIDGQENPLSAYLTGKFEEVQPYVTMWNYSYDIFLINISPNTWNSLSDEDKAIFDECGKEACAAEVIAAREADAGFRKTVEDAGVKITDLTAEQQAEFVNAMAPLYDKYKDIIGEDVYAAFGYTFG